MKLLKKLSLCVVFFAALAITCFASENDIYQSDDGSYTFEYTVDRANAEYCIVVVAGDYTEKEMPEISQDNIIYINQVCSDSNKKIVFSDFIPLTGSVGTIYIGGADAAENAGLLMTDLGIGFIAGRLISYSGESGVVTLPSDITSIDSGVLDDAENITGVIIGNSEISLQENIIAKGIKLFFSPVASKIKQFAIDNGYAYGILGDYTGDDSVAYDDMTAALGHFAGDTSASPDDFKTLFDLDFNGTVNLRDVSILLEYLGGKIIDFFK